MTFRKQKQMSRERVLGGNQPLAPTRIRTRTIPSYRNSKEDPSYKPSSRSRKNDRARPGNEKWENAAATNFINGSWTREEDETIVEWVKEHGPTCWTKLADLLPGRIGKQCRERWHNSLNPSVIKSQWTPQEDELICKYQAKLGNKWARISDMLPGRTDNAVKNRWNSTLKKRAAQILANMAPSANSSSTQSSDDDQDDFEDQQSSPAAHIPNKSEINDVHEEEKHEEEEVENSAEEKQDSPDDIQIPPRIFIPTPPVIEKNLLISLLSPVSPPSNRQSPLFNQEKDSPRLIPTTPTFDWGDPWNDNLDLITNKSPPLYDVDQLLCPDL